MKLKGFNLPASYHLPKPILPIEINCLTNHVTINHKTNLTDNNIQQRAYLPKQ